MKIGSLVASLILFNAVAYSEPSTVTGYLMQEPVSSLDFGLFRVEEALKAPQLHLGGIEDQMNVSAGAIYDWDANRIDVRLTVLTASRQSLGSDSGKDMCRRIVGYARGTLGVEMDTGKRLSPKYEWLFRSGSYAKSNAPSNIGQELDTITELTVVILSPDKKGSYTPSLECSGRLLSTEVFFKS